ncbi:MAG: hypothetical protein EB127_21560, partial [Alphaproteobacteria bacterium]|nr:hypothetical protein [Alphaproteobacteria bacterium]
TDGNVITKKHHKRFKITSIDLDWIERIRSIVCPTAPIRKSKVNNNYEFAASNQTMLDWLVSYGCVPNKSKTLQITKDIPKEYYRDFVRGAIDGDGSISHCRYCKKKKGKEYYYNKVTVYLCGASLPFLQQVKDMIPEEINSILIDCGRTNSIIRGREVKATTNVYRLTINDSNARKVLDWLYYPEHNISLNRKRIKVEEIRLLK